MAHENGRFADRGPGNAWARIEIDAQLVRMIQIIAAHRVWVEVDAAQVDHPRKLGEIRDDDLVGGAARGKRQLHRLYPIGPLVGSAFLEEELAFRAVHVAFQNDGPVSNPAERSFTDFEIIVNELELAEPCRRKIELGRIRDLHVLSGDGQDLRLDFLGHAVTIVAVRERSKRHP